jgi:glycosyltransferase involved in cell wall biosynthesis
VRGPGSLPDALTIERIPPAPFHPPLFYGAGAPEILDQGGPAVWLQALHFWGGLSTAIHRRASHWDRVISHWLLPCGLAAMIVAPRLPHQAWAHSGDVALLERLPIGRALARFMAARQPADLVFVSEDLRQRFAALAGRSVGRVERLTPPLALFSPPSVPERARLRRRLGIDGPTAISVGRLVPIKGFDLLLNAFARWRAPEPRPRLVIVGEGPARGALEGLALRHGIDLHLPGMLPRSQVADWLKAADVYIQPSRVLGTGRREGLPLSTLEALAVGRPVVAAGSGGLAELAGGPTPPGDVTVVAPGDTAELATAVELAFRHRGAPNVAAG